MNLNDFYKSIISAGDLKADDKGFVSACIEDQSVPFIVNEKQVVLPLNEQLRSTDWSKRIVFHPMAEAAQHSESVIMQKFRRAINIKLNRTVSALMTDLLGLAISVDVHKNLSPDQANILTILKNADNKTLSNFRSIIKNMGIDPSNSKSIVHLYLKRAGSVLGINYTRVCIVNFPLFEELVKKDKTVYGVQIRNIDREIYIELLKKLFPQIEEQESYCKGSNSDIAPFLECLMRSVFKLIDCINAVIENYKGFTELSTDLMYDTSWAEQLDNMTQFLKELRTIPMQEGNEGSNPSVPVKPVALPTVYGNASGYSPQAPQMPAAPERKITASGGLDFNSLMQQPMHQPPPMYQQQPMYPQQQPMYPQQPMYQQQPMYPQQQPMYQQPMYQSQPMYPQQQPMSPGALRSSLNAPPAQPIGNMGNNQFIGQNQPIGF